MRRYLIRRSFTGALISWSHSLPQALRCAHGMRMRSICCFVEMAR